MGLLTNANSSQGPLPTMLAKLIAKAQLLSWLMYLIGVFFIFLMPHPEYSHKTYFSENALLPGKITISVTYFKIVIIVYLLHKHIPTKIIRYFVGKIFFLVLHRSFDMNFFICTYLVLDYRTFYEFSYILYYLCTS